VGVWVPVGLSGTDTDSPLPNPNGSAGDYKTNGGVNTPLVKSINCIYAETNGTNLSTPLQMAKWYLDHYGRPGVTAGIILETDGHPQVGFESGDQTTTNYAYTCQAVIDAASAAKADTTNSPTGIQIFTIGYGVDSTSKCPTRTTTMSASNSSNNMYETTTWSGKSAMTMLCAVATQPIEPYCFDNPPSSELASDFQQAATELSKGTSRLIQLYPAPVVTSVSTGGPSVSIGGEYFTGASKVYFGNAPATSFTVGNDNSITAVAPAGPSGKPVPVTVSTPGGISVITGASYYTYP
jgi:hypothetical protein